MATQNVKFHSTTAQKYSGIENPDAGSLYFLSDNGEIRKGDKHITGTRVFKAIDTVKGCSPVESLSITLDGVELSESSEQPKRGDMLTVTHYLTTKMVQATDSEGNLLFQDGDETTTTDNGNPVMVEVANEEGPVEYSAYIYAVNGGAYNASGWQACDGNVDASKVILTSNITMAGNYTEVGNFSKTKAGKNSTFMQGGTGTAGASVYELIKQMLSKTIEPEWISGSTVPTASVSWGNTYQGTTKVTSVEVGTTVNSTYTITLNDAKAQYDGGKEQYAGCKVDTSTGKGYYINGSTTAVTSYTASNANKISWEAGVDTLPSVKAAIDYTSGTNIIKNNLEEPGDITQISAGKTATSSAKSPTISTYRNCFWMSFGTDDLYNKGLNGTLTFVSSGEEGADDYVPADLTSDMIRADGVKSGSATPFSVIPATNFKSVLVFIPKSLNKQFGSGDSVLTEKGYPYSFYEKFEQTIVIKGAGSDNGVEYNIFGIYTGGKTVEKDDISITWK